MASRMSLSLVILLQAALFAIRGFAACECGYSVNATSSSQYEVFTEVWETDFLHLTALSSSVGWLAQVYNVTAAAARGPDGKEALRSNVIPNPLSSQTSWDGNAIHGGDPGLQLWVRSALSNGMISMGEIDGLNNDMLYGSYRIAVKHANVSGTCGAFFWYRNNSQEIDMEFLSKEFSSDNSTVNLVNQTPASLAAGFNAAGTPDFLTPSLDFDPSAAYHEYRFDWIPGQVTFYVDGTIVGVMTDDIPTDPGHAVINHWSNGDPNWSSGPPASDTVMTVMYVKAYFNSTSTHPSYAKDCAKYDPSKVCQIPDQTSPPTLSSNPPTYFFFMQSNETTGQTTSNSTWNSNGQHNAASARFGDAAVLAKTLVAVYSLWFLASLSIGFLS